MKLVMLLLSCLCSGITFNMNQRLKFDNSIWMDSNQQYKFDWSIDRAQKVIRVAITVKTTGWVGFGFSKGHKMDTTRADVALGWINLNGEVTFKVSECFSFFIKLNPQNCFRLTFTTKDIVFTDPCCQNNRM